MTKETPLPYEHQQRRLYRHGANTQVTVVLGKECTDEFMLQVVQNKQHWMDHFNDTPWQSIKRRFRRIFALLLRRPL